MTKSYALNREQFRDVLAAHVSIDGDVNGTAVRIGCTVRHVEKVLARKTDPCDTMLRALGFRMEPTYAPMRPTSPSANGSAGTKVVPRESALRVPAPEDGEVADNLPRSPSSSEAVGQTGVPPRPGTAQSLAADFAEIRETSEHAGRIIRKSGKALIRGEQALDRAQRGKRERAPAGQAAPAKAPAKPAVAVSETTS